MLFSGQVRDGASEAAVKANLARHLRIDSRKATQLFSGRTVVIDSELTRKEAESLQAALARLGAVVRIKDMTPVERAPFGDAQTRPDHTLEDITAAHLECPRCSHLQLDTQYCARCGVDIATATKQKRKEDLLIEKKIRELRAQKNR